jgi:hypothetical protein
VPNYKSIVFTLFAFVLIIVALWLFWGYNSVAIAHHFLGGVTPTEAGDWGDSFGSMNALIGALSLVGILATLIIQAIALNQQKSDIAIDRKAQYRQQFDLNFFQLITLMREIRSEIYFKYSKDFIDLSGRTAVNTAHGPEALSRAAREVDFWIREEKKKNIKLTHKKLARIYIHRVHSRNETRFGPYYRIIYTILRRISQDSFLSDAEKRQYGNLLRSQLQSREVLLLALNGLTPASNDLRKYLVEFRIMKYLPSRRLKDILLAGYPKETFEPHD